MTPANRKTILELVQISDIGLLFSCLGIAYGLTSHRHLSDLLNSSKPGIPFRYSSQRSSLHSDGM